MKQVFFYSTALKRRHFFLYVIHSFSFVCTQCACLNIALDLWRTSWNRCGFSLLQLQNNLQWNSVHISAAFSLISPNMPSYSRTIDIKSNLSFTCTDLKYIISWWSRKACQCIWVSSFLHTKIIVHFDRIFTHRTVLPSVALLRVSKNTICSSECAEQWEITELQCRQMHIVDGHEVSEREEKGGQGVTGDSRRRSWVIPCMTAFSLEELSHAHTRTNTLHIGWCAGGCLVGKGFWFHGLLGGGIQAPLF